MWRYWKKPRLLYKYIISYLFIFLVPFLLMSMIIYYNSVSSLRKEIEQSNINKLEQVENITNERMKELETLAARISYDPRLTPYMFSHNYYGGEAIDELNKYKANSSIIEELFIYYHNAETIYSTHGSYSIDALLNNKYRFNEWKKQDLLNDLHSTIPFIKPIDHVVINEDEHENMIAYLFPISPGNPSPYGTVMYFIKERKMTDLIQNILGDFEGNAYIINEDNQIIASSINDDSINIKKVDYASSSRSGINNVTIDGKDYSMVSVKSDMINWKFITVMDSNQFFKRLGNTSLIVFILLVIIFIIGFILAILLGNNQYKPIRNIVEITRKGKNNTQEMEGGNELETIRQTITNVFEDHQTLNEAMYMQKPFARDQFFVKLLKGDIPTKEEIETLSKALQIDLKGGTYFVGIIYFDKGMFHEANMLERENLFNKLSDMSFENANAHGIDLLYNDAMAVIISIEESAKQPSELRKQLVLEIRQFIKEFSLIEPTIGVGGLYTEKIQINRSYIEALATIEYKFINPPGSIIYFEDISLEPEQSLGYPKEEQIKIIQSIKQGDKVVAIETLRHIFSKLDHNDYSIQVLKCICFDIINTIVKTISETGLSNNIQDFNRIVDFYSIEQLHTRLETLVLDICQEVKGKKESHNDQLRNDILAYIQENYQHYELSLESIALKFKLSVSYLSRFIKEQTGVTFTQYVQELRMENVKKQLKETQQPIKDIVVQVGYKDVANFTRKFKKIIGVTPGQYRKLNR
ncbi:helix-turn-helix domain-containing protein [Agaribacter marinus]|uniref:Helix-turn-helix domain-containing protein n=1 Tax=Virgibacillus salarius TaxID=447199 RepID=A0A941DUS4_9BACI|nr:helix-turn-helix domain-containing protein [Virgibacillus salarius]MBR7795776.1 helix-turn-helix domain-containing protein [Virgibacillus salarius]NAZ08489.1 helix-turn-helix domain-containing protein [Agaribacter marinus]